MTAHRMLFATLFALAGCLQSVDPAGTPLSSTDDNVSVSDGPLCPAVVCNPDGTCPTCNGQTPACDANNDCFYTLTGGGPHPPVCPASTCNADVECAAACPAGASTAHCVSHLCNYSSDPGPQPD